MTEPTITAKEVRFIKLGSGGRWEEDCIEGATPTIRFGFDNPHHSACLQAKWDIIDRFWRKKHPKEATKIVNQTRYFYELGSDALWITFYKRMLWWCFADSKVTEVEPGGSRVRSALGGWKCTDTLGQTLYTDNLSGRLTMVQGFRGTICKVHEQEYLLARINGRTLPEVSQAAKALDKLKLTIKPVIQHLHWKDFELLVDLLFSRAGWQRLSTLGKTEKSIDLDLMSPVTGSRAFVQVKSSANLQTLQKYEEQFRSMDQYNEMFFVVHTPDPSLEGYKSSSGVNVMGLDEIASLVVDSGVTSWLIKKAS